MVQEALGIYCDAFVERGRHELDSRPIVLNAPGVRGVAVIRLLVADDSGYDRLVAELAGPWRGVVFVLDRAPRSSEFMRGQDGWIASGPEMAMVLRDIQAVTDVSLPDGLDFRPVSRVASDAPDGVPLKSAVAAAITADPSITETPDKVAAYLGGLPSSVRVFAAVDDAAVARATSACHVFGEYTQVFFVSTDPDWRHRGIGQAMTVGALRAAACLGARRAFLHATEDGSSIYRHVGFEPVAMLTRYSRAD